MTFSNEQKTILDGPLIRTHVKKRTQSGRQLSYIESWFAIAEANRIFGFDGWSRETLDLKCVAEKEREIGAKKEAGWGVTYTCRVRVTIGGVVRDGCGAGHGIDRDLGLAHESALKEAESDAAKRALMTFGNQFGLALYDKEQSNVVDEAELPLESHRLFMEEARRKIDSFMPCDPALADWWNSPEQKKLRRDLDLSQEDVDALKALVIKRMAK